MHIICSKKINLKIINFGQKMRFGITFNKFQRQIVEKNKFSKCLKHFLLQRNKLAQIASFINGCSTFGMSYNIIFHALNSAGGECHSQ